MLESYPDILTVVEVSSILGIGRNTVYELISSGKISGFRTGKTWKIPRESLIQYILCEAGFVTLHHRENLL